MSTALTHVPWPTCPGTAWPSSLNFAAAAFVARPLYQCVFCQRLPRVVAHYGRKTERAGQALRLIGFPLGGEAGSRADPGSGDYY